jgi:hypothetical protein
MAAMACAVSGMSAVCHKEGTGPQQDPSDPDSAVASLVRMHYSWNSAEGNSIGVLYETHAAGEPR